MGQPDTWLDVWSAFTLWLPGAASSPVPTERVFTVSLWQSGWLVFLLRWCDLVSSLASQFMLVVHLYVLWYCALCQGWLLFLLFFFKSVSLGC